MGWDQILEMQKGSREAPLKERTDCPSCGWPLVKNTRGILGCTYCGWRSAIELRVRRNV